MRYCSAQKCFVAWLFVAPTIGLPFACGAQTQMSGGNQDGATPDGTSPRGEGGTDRGVTGKDGSLAEEGSLLDGSATESKFSPPPFDAREFESCAPYPCNADQICITFAPSDPRNVCDGIPKACEAVPTCPCVEQAAPWCNVHACSVIDGGLVLSCETLGSP
jgi:hypothetical protein